VRISVVIPAYNRRPILTKVLAALDTQAFDDSHVTDYEVVVVDDGSDDGTREWLEAGNAGGRVQVLSQARSGPAAARNLGVERARFDTICFIDSDLVPAPGFLQAHAEALSRATGRDPRAFTCGPVVDTDNFEAPRSEPYKLSDYSRAYFATGNVMIARRWIVEAGGFDAAFGLYGWEDLELGVRLKRRGLRMVPAPQAIGYHWHPRFSFDQWPSLVAKEQERGRTAIVFFRKHPTWAVRLMIQLTWPQRLLWEGLTLGGLLDRPLYEPLIIGLLAHGRPYLAAAVSRIVLNRYYVRALFAATRTHTGVSGVGDAAGPMPHDG
jgi:glycosyltransferase involved in cell wall biosynthesis